MDYSLVYLLLKKIMQSDCESYIIYILYFIFFIFFIFFLLFIFYILYIIIIYYFIYILYIFFIFFIYYFLLSTLVLTLYIDVVLSLSISMCSVPINDLNVIKGYITMRKINLMNYWNCRRNCFENIFDLDNDWQVFFINFMLIEFPCPFIEVCG